MGKDSLIKSTAKKKDADQEKEEAKKTKTTRKAAPKKKAKAKAKRTAPKKSTKKAAAKKKAPKKKAKATTPKAKVAAKPKPVKKTAKQKAAAKPKPAAKAVPPKKKPSIKELLMKKFDSASAPRTPRPAADTPSSDQFVAPPFFSGRSEDETKRLKALLLKKFDLDAPSDEPTPEPTDTEPQAPAPEPAVTEPETPPEVKAEEPPPAPEPAVEPPPPVIEEPADPAEKMLKYLAGAFVFLVILVIGASVVNQGRFYLNPSNGAVEIWQGKFAPKGQKLLIALPGVEVPEMESAVYTKQDVYPIVFNYYIDKADAILDVPGAPNFDEVKVYLDQALAYAVTPDLRDVANARINNIDLLILMYKADVAGSRGTIESLEVALDYLAEAKHLATDLQAQQIDQKIDAFSAALVSLKAAQAEAEQLEADRQQLEQAQGEHQE